MWFKGSNTQKFKGCDNVAIFGSASANENNFLCVQFARKYKSSRISSGECLS